jgi:hypothetical protein
LTLTRQHQRQEDGKQSTATPRHHKHACATRPIPLTLRHPGLMPGTGKLEASHSTVSMSRNETRIIAYKACVHAQHHAISQRSSPASRRRLPLRSRDRLRRSRRPSRSGERLRLQCTQHVSSCRVSCALLSGVRAEGRERVCARCARVWRGGCARVCQRRGAEQQARRHRCQSRRPGCCTGCFAGRAEGAQEYAAGSAPVAGPHGAAEAARRPPARATAAAAALRRGAQTLDDVSLEPRADEKHRVAVLGHLQQPADLVEPLAHDGERRKRCSTQRP